MNDDELRRRVRAVLEETDPVRRVALSRRLRAEVWDLLGEAERDKLRGNGIDLDRMPGPLRQVK
ncbi:MAG: hypothetical protein R3D85_09555 [Paracoccaceae bacterium]